MRKSLVLVLGAALALMLAPSANAAVTTIFDGETSPLNCVADAAPPSPIPANSRFCGNHPAASTVTSFDGTPIDVYVALPPDPGGTETERPVVAFFHGWGGSKINLKTEPLAQNLLAQGFIVMSMSARGWANSCGGPSLPLGGSVKPAPCEKGYVHLMHNAYEVRDAQTILGKLADDQEDTNTNYLIDADDIGAAGGSYGGAMSAALAMLKNRVQLTGGGYASWESPVDERALEIGAAAPQFTWSDLPAALAPNGSTLDYAKDNPYNGPADTHRTGTAKQQWLFSLYASGLAAAYYGPGAPIGPGYPDPAGNMFGWYGLLTTGGPYDGSAATDAALTEIQDNHSAYYIPIDNAGQRPAPMLISSGWNDDLFPVSESVRLYTKVRETAPTTPVVTWGIDIGHTPRSNQDSTSRAADAAALVGTQVAWMLNYLKGIPAPLLGGALNPVGGAVATSSKCGTGASAQTRVAGDLTIATSWQKLANGEVSIESNVDQTIEPSTTPSDQFVSGATTADVCDYAGRTDDTDGAAVYTVPAAGTGGYTIMGSPTVDVTLDVTGANDQVIARLYDVNPAGIGHQRLIGRAIMRPQGVGNGPTAQTFQIYPQNYKVEAGNTLKLELLSKDSPYAQNAKNVAQKPIEVKSLRMEIPVKETSGAAGGQVADLSPKTIPTGYQMSQDALDSDTQAPVTTDNVPATPQKSVTVTLDANDIGISGVKETRYEVGVSPSATNTSTVYDPNNKPTLADGEKISYLSIDNAGNEESAVLSAAAIVDSVPPDSPTITSAPAASISTNTASISFSSIEIGGGFVCSLDGAPSSACTSPVNLAGLAVGARSFSVWAVDAVGNVSTAPSTVNFTVTGALTTTVAIGGTVEVGEAISANPTSKAFGESVTGVKYTYRWTANGKRISSRKKVRLQPKWMGKRIAVRVTASKAGYTGAVVTKTATRSLK